MPLTTESTIAARVAGFIVGLSLIVLCAPAADAQVGTPKYPNVRALPPYEVFLGRETVNFQRHYVVRFSTAMYNAGPGTLELHGEPRTALDVSLNATQWIYGEPAGVRMEPVGTFMFHAVHQHFHFDGYGRYELWTKRAYDRAQSTGFTTGTPSFVSPKVSFCMFDTWKVDSNAAPIRVYQTCTPALQGVSAGYADVYDWALPDQWIDVGTSPLPDGQYVIRNIADPFNIIFESDGKGDPAKESHTANDGATLITIANGQLAATEEIG